MQVLDRYPNSPKLLRAYAAYLEVRLLPPCCCQCHAFPPHCIVVAAQVCCLASRHLRAAAGFTQSVKNDPSRAAQYHTEAERLDQAATQASHDSALTDG